MNRRVLSGVKPQGEAESLNLVIHDYAFFEQLQNLWYRSTHLGLGLFWSKKLDVKFSRVFIRYIV